MRFEQPKWHKLYSRRTSVALVSSIIRAYCRSALIAVRRLAAQQAERDAQPIVFDVAPASSSDDRTADVARMAAPPMDAPIADHLAYTAAKVWGKPSLRPRQTMAVHKLVYEKDSKGKLLVVDRTGGGKSLIFSLSATMVGGVVLIIIPLLALTANQMSKLKEAISDYGAVDVHHLDELQKNSVKDKLIPKLLSLSPNTSSTIFLLSSPQFLAENGLLRNALLQCQKRRTLHTFPNQRSRPWCTEDDFWTVA